MDETMRNLDEQALHAMFRPLTCRYCDDRCPCHDYADVNCVSCDRVQGDDDE